jgi:D-xylose transport system permease protein
MSTTDRPPTPDEPTPTAQVTGAPTDEHAAAAIEQPPAQAGGQLALRIAQLGSLRVALVLAAIWIVFQSQNDNFLSSFNLTNLVLQIAAVGTISIGVVLVLLLGEIDLSVGAVSGLAAAVMAVLNVKHGWAPIPAIGAGLAVGAGIGLINGFFVTTFQIPSFVVTLAGLLAWQGALLLVLGDTGTVNLSDDTITGLAGTFYGDAVGWALVVIVIASYAASGWLERVRRGRAGLPLPSLRGFLVRLACVAAGTIAAVLVLLSDRGIPLAGLILLGLCAIGAFLTTRTSFGRHIYSTGGNAEATRRAGVSVRRVRMVVFVSCSTLAAFGGIMAASRLLAVNQGSGGSDLLLLAIAGPVIAGTSLFGGRGSIWDALLGALVIGSIANGMDLLALESGVKFMITGGVLLLAVVIDAVIKNQRERAGAARSP